MNAWSRVPVQDCSDGASRAQSILTRMENMHSEGSMPTLKPDKKCYTCVLNAWSRSRQPNKAQQACALLQKIESLYKDGNEEFKPDLCLYKTVMNTAAFIPFEENIGQQQRDALDITYQTFMNLDKNGHEFGMEADSVIYSMFLKACRNLMPADSSRNSVVKAVFGKCCREGLVGAIVLKELKKCCAQNDIGQILWNELILENARNKISDLNGEIPNLEDLPQQWSRFVKKNQPRP